MAHLSDEKDLMTAGLNLVAVFDLSALPADMHGTLSDVHDLAPYRQLVLVGHGGRGMWQALHQRGQQHQDDPVDSHSMQTLEKVLVAAPECRTFTFLYPGNSAGVSLTKMGALARWHHQTPFGIGIHPVWGCWFAYRALVLADSDFAPEAAEPTSNPCVSCAGKPCVSACPAGAVATDAPFDAPACFDFRLKDGSICASQCLARSACPVGRDHAYDPAQQAYHADRSRKMLQIYRDSGAG